MEEPLGLRVPSRIRVAMDMQHYTLSPAGKRNALALMIGALVIWAFALWTFRSTVGSVPGEPTLGFVEALGRNLSQGFGLGQSIPALLTLGLIVATPLVFWNVVTEYAASYTFSEQGLAFQTVGLALQTPWAAIIGVRDDEPTNERGSTLLLAQDVTAQIRNPVVRLLHRLSYGRTALPLYAMLENRAELLAEIALHSGKIMSTEVQAG